MASAQSETSAVESVQYLGLTIEHLPNNEQRQAIETIDGSVLVVAGPGTGKTELLSLRVANILANRDLDPSNILCLTYTEAGAEAMSKRLARFIGKQAYAVRINTFHAFASYLQTQHIEYFNRSPFDSLITDLQAKKLICDLLTRLSISDALYQKPYRDGVPGNLRDVKEFIGKIKKSGLSTDELRIIVQQSLETINYLKEHTDLVESMLADVPRAAAAKAAHCDELKTKTALIFESLPAELLERKVTLIGSYEPYGRYLAKRFAAVEWYEGENNKTTGFQALRKEHFDKKTGDFNPSLRKRYRKMLSALKLYDDYQEHLRNNGLYDFDDMILDTIAAIEASTELQAVLQEQYQYILVDEFQDTNGSQMRIIELLTEGLEAPNIMAVGDDDQAIMRFQGASVAFLKQFEETYRETQRIVLKTNYRSTPSLVELGQNVARQIEGRSQASLDEKQLVAHRHEEEPVEFSVKTYASPELQYFAVARAIKQRIDEGFIGAAKNPQEAIAVIAWRRSSLAALIPYLNMLGIEYSYDTLTTVGKAESLQSFLACLRYVAYLAKGDVKRADPWLPAVCAAVELGVPAKEYVPFALAAKENPRGWTAEMMSLTNSKEGQENLSSLSSWLAQAAKTAEASSAVRALHFLAKPFIAYHQAQAQAQKNPFDMLEFNYGIARLLEFVEGETNMRRKLNGQDLSLKLHDLCELLGETSRFDVPINITMPIARPEAVALKTAHGSKGLEYDLVYLIDADEATWHGRQKSSSVSCPNIYLNESRDDDDMRRLLFVAITRARFELEISLGKSGIVGELLGSVSEESIELSPTDISVQSMALWQDGYYPGNQSLTDQSLTDLVHATIANKSLSASTLNAFVTFDAAESPDGRSFVLKRAFNFPQSPVTHFEFGSLVHRYLELYLNHVIKAKTLQPDELLVQVHAELELLDFEEGEIARMRERLDLIAQVFIPGTHEYLNADSLAEQWLKATVDDIPLVGRADLLLFDDERKTIQIGDFKTGKPEKFDAAYMRQLVFYKLLIEEGGLYPGWTVSGGMDIFVEPDPTTHELPSVQKESVSDDMIAHVRALIQAVYWRIQNADFDTSSFNTNDIEKRDLKKEDLQHTFELWLIKDHTERLAG